MNYNISIENAQKKLPRTVGVLRSKFKAEGGRVTEGLNSSLDRGLTLDRFYEFGRAEELT